MMRIGVLGMGGIGSFIGSQLTKNFKNDSDKKIIFICRNETKAAIKKNGLLLKTDKKTLQTHPDLVSDNPEEIGLLDILIIATKSFSLELAVVQYQDCLKKESIIIPLQNGVNAKSRIERVLNHDSSKILEGCIYVASNLDQPGVVRHVGGAGKIFFGNNEQSNFQWVENALVKGGLKATYTTKIKEIVWKKYLFVSPLATMTTALDITFGEVAENSKNRAQLKEMMGEVRSLAHESNLSLTEKDIENSVAVLDDFPYASKSSLQLDFEHQNSKTEKDILVDFVIKKGRELGVSVENYEEMNEKIKARISN